MSSKLTPEMKAKLAAMVATLDSHPDTLDEELRASPLERVERQMVVSFQAMRAPKLRIETYPKILNHGPKPWSKKAKRGR